MTLNPLKPSKYEWLCFAGVFLLILLTQRWMSVHAGIDYLIATDSNSYLEIARSAPGFSKLALPYHHAQRFFFVWLFGSIFSVVVPEWVMRVASSITLVGTAAVWIHLICQLTMSRGLRILAGAFFFLNPYTYRYYLLAPAILPDQIFQFGLVSLLYGIILWTQIKSGQAPSSGGLWILMGSLVCGLSRQTSLLMIPGLLLWAAQTRRPVLFLIPSFIFVVGYLVTGMVAKSFAGPSGNLEHILGIFSWIFSSEFSIVRLGEHLLRAFLPVLPILLAIAFSRTSLKVLKAEVPLLLMWAGLFSQPILAGPLHTTGNGSRLAVLSLSLLIVIWIRLQKNLETSVSRWSVFSLFILSFHHMYTVVGPSTLKGYLLLQTLGLSVLAVVLFKFSATKIPAKNQNKSPF